MNSHEAIVEADRRDKMFSHRNKPTTDKWLGLGFATEYKAAINAGLMVWIFGPPAKRCNGWLQLTDKGLAALESYRAAIAKATKGGK